MGGGRDCNSLAKFLLFFLRSEALKKLYRSFFKPFENKAGRAEKLFNINVAVFCWHASLGNIITNAILTSPGLLGVFAILLCKKKAFLHFPFATFQLGF